MRRCRVSADLAPSIDSTCQRCRLYESPSKNRFVSGSASSASAKSVGDLDRPWLGVELDVDIDLLARCDARGFAVLPAEGKHEDVAVRRHRAAVRVGADGDTDGWTFALPEPVDDLGRDGDAGGGLPFESDRRSEPHRTSLLTVMGAFPASSMMWHRLGIGPDMHPSPP